MDFRGKVRLKGQSDFEPFVDQHNWGMLKIPNIASNQCKAVLQRSCGDDEIEGCHRLPA